VKFILSEKPGVAIETFLVRCKRLGLDTNKMKSIATRSIEYYMGDKKKRGALRISQRLENEWYESLKTGKPYWGVYGTDYYVADLWACWVVYSRRYLLSILSKNSMPDGSMVYKTFGEVNSIADLGCGIGYTTAALKQIFPQAHVIGTNFPDIPQTNFAINLGNQYGFNVVPEISHINNKVDLLLASEYFEHIPAPIDHLIEVIDTLRPKNMLIANAFTARSIGHFPQYMVNGQMVDGKATSRLFNNELRNRGYEKVKTKLWNNRPSYWKLPHVPTN
jgi:SAM-dependent methyltransferase